MSCPCRWVPFLMLALGAGALAGSAGNPAAPRPAAVTSGAAAPAPVHAVGATPAKPTTRPAKAAPAAVDTDDDPSMRFTVLGPDDPRCPATRCGVAAIGIGDVRERTPADFVLFMEGRHGATVRTLVLQSYGGDFGGGLQLGLLIRKHRLATAVAPDGGCWSACAYAFLGGVKRQVAASGHYGLHTGAMVSVAVGSDDVSSSRHGTRKGLLQASEEGYRTGVGDAGLLMRYAHAMGAGRGFLAATLRSYGDTYDLNQGCMAWLHITTNRKRPRRDPCPGVNGVRAWLCRTTPGMSNAEVEAMLGGKGKSCAGNDEGVNYRMF